MEIPKDQNETIRKNQIKQQNFYFGFADSSSKGVSHFFTEYILKHCEAQKIPNKKILPGVKVSLQICEKEENIGLIAEYEPESTWISEIYQIKNIDQFLNYIKQHSQEFYENLQDLKKDIIGKTFLTENKEKILLSAVNKNDYYFVLTETSLEGEGQSQILFSQQNPSDITKFNYQVADFLKKFFDVSVFGPEISEKLIEKYAYQLLSQRILQDKEDNNKEIVIEIMSLISGYKKSKQENLEKNTSILSNNAFKEFQGEQLLQLPFYKKDSGFFDHEKYSSYKTE